MKGYRQKGLEKGRGLANDPGHLVNRKDLQKARLAKGKTTRKERREHVNREKEKGCPEKKEGERAKIKKKKEGDQKRKKGRKRKERKRRKKEKGFPEKKEENRKKGKG